MRQASTPLTGVERTFDVDEIIVSKTDLKGRITYANQIFLKIAGYTEAEVIGKPHSLIRHPEMPRAVFRYLWETIAAGREVFAYVVNRAKNGDHYWVFAHVTPTFDAAGRIIGYHSSRRVADRSAVRTVSMLYADLRQVEARHATAAAAADAGLAALRAKLESLQVGYEEFVFSLARRAVTSELPVGDRKGADENARPILTRA